MAVISNEKMTGMKILVLIDMQNDFVTGSLGTSEARAAVPFIVERIKNWRGTIFATQDTHEGDYVTTQEGQITPTEHCRMFTDGWRICPEIEKVLPIVTKGVLKNTFASDKLVQRIRDLHVPIKEIIIMGFCTDVGVISNAILLRSFFPKTVISVDAAGCAGVTQERHLTALKAMKNCQIHILHDPDLQKDSAGAS